MHNPILLSSDSKDYKWIDASDELIKEKAEEVVNEAIHENLTNFINDDVSKELRDTNFNNVAINQLKLKMLELIKNEILRGDIREEYFLKDIR